MWHHLRDLDREVTEEEIHIALMQVPAEKALGQTDTSKPSTRNVGPSSRST
jgi:hypothetical protein